MLSAFYWCEASLNVCDLSNTLFFLRCVSLLDITETCSMTYKHELVCHNDLLPCVYCHPLSTHYSRWKGGRVHVFWVQVN